MQVSKNSTERLSRFTTGEGGVRLGPELILHPHFPTLSTWAIYAGSGTLRTDTPPVGYTGYVRAQSGDGSYDRLEPASNITGLTVGAKYCVQALVRRGVETLSEQGFFAFSFTNGAEAATLNSVADWTWLRVTVTATVATGRPRLYLTRGNGSTTDYVDCAYFSMKQVL
ncbi:MAG: hypothetical protein WAX89_05645 [Alphaproteobacteria bacterium]